ncbi:hypothetical protein [Rubrimonas cliftonensis]|uniref:Uncharacterized protein n=1 Tax=Rubrimonas cliftonensis TaxID=89524 RepID=A0A1H3X1M3_9RHOB|nr:hypothetical protein [Rubrimonas cliftonensis]SDZ93153.1 hypothetical protein SAMN05444370_102230 [Rubrimonas cliftonensis]
MSENKTNSIYYIAGALVVGALVGAAVASRNDGEQAAMERRIVALEGQLAEAGDAGADAAAAAAQSAADATASGLAALETRVDTMASETADALAAAADTAGDATAESVAAVSDRVSVLAQQMAAIVGRIEEMGSAAAPGASSGAAPEAAPEAAASEGGAASAEAEAAAAPAPEPETEPETVVIPEGAIELAVGQTAQIGGSGVFLSRVDAEAQSAQVLIVGAGRATVSDQSDPVTLSDGCTLKLAVTMPRRAAFTTVCPE